MILKHSICVFLLYVHLRIVVSDVCRDVTTVTSATVSEASPVGSDVFEIKYPRSTGPDIKLTMDSITFHKSDNLTEFYSTAIGFSSPLDGDPLQCKQKPGQSCTVVVKHKVDAELITSLAGEESQEEALRNTYRLICKSGPARSVGMPYITMHVVTVNEFAPHFDPRLRDVQVPECTPVNTVLANLSVYVTDSDVGMGEGVAKIVLDNPTDVIALDGRLIKLNKILNYDEQLKKDQTLLTFTLKAITLADSSDVCVLGDLRLIPVTSVWQDGVGTGNRSDMILNVTDCDTHPPYFSSFGCKRLEPCDDVIYKVALSTTYTGLLKHLMPGDRIVAEDGDTLNALILYSLHSEADHGHIIRVFAQGQTESVSRQRHNVITLLRQSSVTLDFVVETGPNDYQEFLEISETNGGVTVVKPLKEFDKDVINVTITATESTPLQRSANATLVLFVGIRLKSKNATSEYYNDNPQAAFSEAISNKLFLLLAAGLPALAIFLLAGIVGVICLRRKKRSRQMPERRSSSRVPSANLMPPGLPLAGSSVMMASAVEPYLPEVAEFSDYMSEVTGSEYSVSYPTTSEVSSSYYSEV